MSMDLNFWKYKEGLAHNNEVVYKTACCEGKQMEELETLPINDILKKIATVFSSWNIQNNGKDFENEQQGRDFLCLQDIPNGYFSRLREL